MRPFKLGLALAAAVSLPALLSAQSFKTEKSNIGGEGSTDYLNADPATGRVFISRSTHVMVVDGATGKVLGDIMDTPRVHGIAFAPKEGRGFTTNAGDSTVTMFDLATLAVQKRIRAGIDGLDGIMYDAATDRILTINHSHVAGKAAGTATVIDATSGTVVKQIPLSGAAPEGGVADGKGHIFINIEDGNAIDVVDTKTWTVSSTWKIEPCEEPTGIAYDKSSDRLFSGCSDKSVAVDAATGKVVAELANGAGVDAIGWDASQKLLYIPAGQSGNVTVYHQDAPDRYSMVETVATMRGAKTIAVDEVKHRAYVFTPEYGPAPQAAAGAPPAGRGRARGPIIGAWFISISR
jgi:DNA-binding beta-propeller fold protein YncE